MINKRLEVVNRFIDKNDILADIGCDHGYLGIMALNKGVKFVQFIDNKQGPLNQAKLNCENIDSNCIEFTLSSGFNDLNDNVDTIAFCGVGGELLIEVINEDLDKAKKLKKLILQPNKNEDRLRKYLFENNFKIIDEEVVFDKDKYYEIILCKYVNEAIIYNDLDIKYGPILRINKSNTFISKWNEKLSKYQKINQNNPNLYNNEIEEIKKIIEK